MSELAILINSCDAYNDVWEPFFRILEKTWPDANQYDIYINTETKNYKDTFFDVKVLNSLSCGKSETWGQRLVNALNRIEAQYVLFMLEDFFFEEPVYDQGIQDGLECLKHDNRIACVSLNSELECSNAKYCTKNESKIYKGFIPKKHFAQYKISAGPALWRVKSLIKWTSVKDTPWEWEFFGSYRTWSSRDKFYGRVYDAKPIFVYDVYHGGAVHRGKWVGYKVRELINNYKLDFDINKRGYVEDWRTDKDYLATPPVKQRLKSILQNRWKMFSCKFQGFFLDLKN